MKNLADAIQERYMRLQLDSEDNIGTAYNNLTDEVVNTYNNLKLSELRKLTKTKKNLAKYYDNYVYLYNDMLELSDETFIGVLCMYARMNYLTHKLSYVDLLSKDELVSVLSELTILERIFLSIFEDNHNDAMLAKMTRSVGYLYYTNKEFRVKNNKSNSNKSIIKSIINSGCSVKRDKDKD